MLNALLIVLSYYPARQDDAEVQLKCGHSHLIYADSDAVRYRILEMPSRDDDGDDDDGNDGLRPPAFSYYQPHQGNVSDKVRGVMAVKQTILQTRMSAANAFPTRISLAFAAASPITRGAMEASSTDGVVYLAPMVIDSNGALVEPNSEDKRSFEGCPLMRQPVLTVRVGPIERELGQCFTLKLDVTGYDPPFLGYGRDWQYNKVYRQITIHSTSLARDSVAWRILEASAWWWRDRRIPASNTTHPLCVSSESLKGPVSFPPDLFGDGPLLQSVRLRGPFVAHPYYVSDAVVDVEELGKLHGAHLTELDLYSADRSVNLTRALASGVFTALVYANLSRTTFSDVTWRETKTAVTPLTAPGFCETVAASPNAIGAALPCLEELVLDGCHHLRCLDADVLSHMPNLRKLNVFNCTKLRVIKDLAVCCPFLTQLCCAYTTFETLDFGALPRTLRTGAQEAPTAVGTQTCPATAHHLKLTVFTNCNFDLLSWVAQTPNLETLFFSGYSLFGTGEGLPLGCLEQAQYVRTVNLFCSVVTDLAPLAQCPFLEELVLHGIQLAERANTDGVLDLEPLLLGGVTHLQPHPTQKLKRLVVSTHEIVRLDYRNDAARQASLPPSHGSAATASASRLFKAPPLESLVELVLRDCNELSDLHTLLTLPSDTDSVTQELDDTSPQSVNDLATPLHAARFPSLKILNVSSTAISEIQSIAQHCPLLEELAMNNCNKLRRVTTTLEMLSGFIAACDGAPARAVSQTTHHQVRPVWPRLRTFTCAPLPADVVSDELKNSDEGDAVVTRFFTVISRVCPSLENLHTSPGPTVFHKPAQPDRFPVFPHLRVFTGVFPACSEDVIAECELENVLPVMMPAIEHLTLHSTPCRTTEAKLVSPLNCIDALPKLALLSIIRNDFFGSEHVVTRCKSLRTLLCWSLDLPLLQALRGAHQLNELILSGDYCCDHLDLWAEVAAGNPHMRVITLS